MPKQTIITIDGPSGSGKSSSAKLLAQKLGFMCLNTGMIYRALGWEVAKAGNGISVQSIKKILAHFDVATCDQHNGTETNILVNGNNISQNLFSEHVACIASKISDLKLVRDFMLKLQRELASGKNVIAEGRDAGSVVWPNADVKFFLTADAKIRAGRRVVELGLQHNAATSMDMRDKMDTERNLAPLVKPEGAIIIDSSDMDLNEVVGLMAMKCKERRIG